MEQQKPKVHWESSYETAIERARNEEKPLLLDFFKDG
jgi:hypothetical protein